MGVVAVAQKPLESWHALSALALGLLSASLVFGATCGALAAGWLCSVLRRVRTLRLLAALGALLTGAMCAMPAVGAVIAVRVGVGFAVGLCSVVCPLYVAEQAPAARRGMLSTLFQLSITIGISIAYLVGYAISLSSFTPSVQWRAMFSGSILPALLLFVLTFMLREQHEHEHEHQHQHEHQHEHEHEHEHEQEALLGSVQGESKASGWIGLLHEWRSALVGAMLSLMLALTGINAIFSYAPSIVSSAGFHDQVLWSNLLAAWNVVSTIASIFLIDRAGRRPLIISGLALMCAAAAALWANLTWHGNGFVSLASLLLFISGFAAGPASAFWAVVSEIFPAHVRKQGNALINALVWFENLLLLFLYPIVTKAVGVAVTFAFFAIVALACLLVLAFKLKETKGARL